MQGDSADSFFIVESGEVRIIMTRKVNIPKTTTFFFFTIVTNFAYEILNSANLSSNTLSFSLFLYMIFQGKQDLEENGAVEIARCSRGQYFGELALVTNKPRAASAFALGTVKCLGISQYHFISNIK